MKDRNEVSRVKTAIPSTFLSKMKLGDVIKLRARTFKSVFFSYSMQLPTDVLRTLCCFCSVPAPQGRGWFFSFWKTEYILNVPFTKDNGKKKGGLILFRYHRVIEWLGWQGTSSIVKFQPPCHSQGHHPPDLY